MKTQDLPISMMGESPVIVARYRQLIAKGESPRMAEILATRQAPGLETDTSHYAGMRPLEETCGLDYATKTKAQARKAGITINDSSIYNPTIADQRGGGDPKAWLLAGDGRDKFRKVINAKGKSCDTLGIKVENGKGLEDFSKREKKLEAKQARQAEVKAHRKAIIAKG